jgi:hypothetical protein
MGVESRKLKVEGAELTADSSQLTAAGAAESEKQISSREKRAMAQSSGFARNDT